MSNEHQPKFGQDLAQAAEPEDFDGEKAEPTHDPAKSLNRSLITLYDKYLARIGRLCEMGLINSGKADGLASSVLALAEKDGLRNEIGYTPIERAQEIMGIESYFGPQEVIKADIEIRGQIPAIPFSPRELERAKEWGQMLIYRTDTTMKELDEPSQPNLTNDRPISENLFNYHSHDFYHSDRIQPGWALVSKGNVHESFDKTYHGQSISLARYLSEKVYEGESPPPACREAINELYAQKETIDSLAKGVDSDSQKQLCNLLSNLKINRYYRQTPAELLYDWLVVFRNSGERLYDNCSVVTSVQVPGGYMVRLTFSNPGLVYVDWDKPFFYSAHAGTALSRRY